MGYYLLDHYNPSAQRFGGFWGYPTMSVEPHSIVAHTTESLADLDGPDSGAENVANWFATNNVAASYHTLVDSDSTVDCLPAGLCELGPYTAFHAAGYNSGFLGLSFAMRADSWPAVPEWWAAKILTRGADVAAAWCKRWDIPVVARSKAEIDAGERGITGHGILDPDYRSDPGAAFPWARFIAMIAERVGGLPTSPEDDDMARLIQTPDGTVWSTDGVTAARVSTPQTLAMLRKIGAVPATPEWGTKVTIDEAGDLLVAAGNGGLLPLRTVLAMLNAGGK